jgi:hypothetical protein
VTEIPWLAGKTRQVKYLILGEKRFERVLMAKNEDNILNIRCRASSRYLHFLFKNADSKFNES